MDSTKRLENDRMIDDRIRALVPKYLQQRAFSDRKLTDTPTDDLMLVNRRYVTRNGTTANRPTTSILGESYYDTTIGKPIWWNGSVWKDAAGNSV